MSQSLTIPKLPRPRLASATRPRALPANVTLVALIACLLLTGLWLRIEELDHVPGLNGDEAWSGVQAICFLQGQNVSWRTPTGNPLNVFFWAPLVALHSMLPPSIALLRSVSVVSGVLAVGLNYWLCLRTFDKPTALISTVLLAILPVTIAYSRFAWDASQTPLVSVLVIYASLATNRSILAVCIALATAILVHPTNVFLLPVTFAARLPLERFRPDRRITLAGVVIVTAAIVATGGLGEIAAFGAGLFRLFSGSTVYQFLSGGVHPGEVTLADLVTLVALGMAFLGMTSRLNHAIDPRDLRLVVGTVAALAAFLVVAGPRAVAPHQERYALWCVVPLVLVASRGAAWGWEHACSWRLGMKVAMLGYAVVLLVGFRVHYFDTFARTGGDSHLAFRTGDVDPKQAALAMIERESGVNAPVLVVSQSWWTRLPLRYLSAGDEKIRVESKLPGGFPRTRAWFVELAGSDEHLQVARAMLDEPAGHVRSVCNDRAGRAVVVIYSPQSGPADSLKNFATAQFDSEAN